MLPRSAEADTNQHRTGGSTRTNANLPEISEGCPN